MSRLLLMGRAGSGLVISQMGIGLQGVRSKGVANHVLRRWPGAINSPFVTEWPCGRHWTTPIEREYDPAKFLTDG